MIPGWAQLIGIAIAAGALFWAGDQYGTSARKLDRERAEWASERTAAAQRSQQALQAQIRAHNATLNELEAVHANAEADRAVLQTQAASAAAALDRARAGAGRLRDAIETHRLGTAAALEAAGSAGQCQAATEAADVLRGLFERADALAGRIAGAAAASSLDADRQHAAASECGKLADAVIRNSAR